jgi:hypothetical protein
VAASGQGIDGLTTRGELKRFVEEQVLGDLPQRLARLQANVPLHGHGSPEGVVTANIGKRYVNDDGGAGTTFYVKESGAGNTGWVAK